jgi:hypothetical protein
MPRKGTMALASLLVFGTASVVLAGPQPSASSHPPANHIARITPNEAFIAMHSRRMGRYSLASHGVAPRAARSAPALGSCSAVGLRRSA